MSSLRRRFVLWETPRRHRRLPAFGFLLQFFEGDATSRGGQVIAITVEAVYENGVLKPAQPLPFKEHEKVSITIEERRPTLAERLVALAHALPQETLDRLPADGASQHDHYIYGTPKRPE